MTWLKRGLFLLVVLGQNVAGSPGVQPYLHAIRGVDGQYLIGKSRQRPHPYTDSASAAASLTTGIKTYNDAINVDFDVGRVGGIGDGGGMLRPDADRAPGRPFRPDVELKQTRGASAPLHE